MANTLQLVPELSPPTDDVPLTRWLDEQPEPPAVNEFYENLPGNIVMEGVTDIPGGMVYQGTYHTSRATHSFRVYRPDSLGLATKLPTVAKTGALGTSLDGHNHVVSGDIMRQGFMVVEKGTPHYYSARPLAISLAEDANEMFGLLAAVEKTMELEPSDEVFLYGESQAAMKALGGMAIAGEYDRKVADALIIAACFLKRINVARMDRQVSRLVRMGLGVASFVVQSTREDRDELKGTFDLKDLHHHITVLPRLVSGETGRFLPKIPTDQKFTNLGFGLDGYSHVVKVKDDLESRFPNVDCIILEGLDHVKGIKSKETRNIRRHMLADIRDARA